MMTSGPALRVAPARGAEAPQAPAGAGTDGGFAAALGSIGPARAAERVGPAGEPRAAKVPETSGDDRDAEDTATDPAVAAALMALLGIQEPASSAEGVPDDGSELSAEITTGLEDDASGTGLDADAVQLPDMDEALSQQVVAKEEGGDALPDLAREWSTVRDASLPRADENSRPALTRDWLPGMQGAFPASGATPTTANAALAGTAADAALRSPVGTPRWSEELGSRLVMMTTRGQNEGSLSLSPEHLGPLEVRISVHQGTAQMWFGAQHADTRAALVESLPRLREMLEQAGLSMSQADVSHEAPRREASVGAAAFGASVDAPAVAEAPPAEVRRAVRGLLDVYA